MKETELTPEYVLSKLQAIAELLECHTATVRKLIKEGKLQAKRIGHGYKCLGEDIRHLFNNYV